MFSVPDRQDRAAPPLERHAERRGDVALHRRKRGIPVERDRAAKEKSRIDDSRARAPRRSPSAACRPARSTPGPGTAPALLRPDMQQAALIDPGDAAAAGADALHIDRREAGHVA